MIITNLLCDHYKIREVAIELVCNGLSAIITAFSHLSILSVQNPNYDFIAAIKYVWSHSPMLWKVHQVKGHQDDVTDISQLDRWSQLYVEVDKIAKDRLNIVAQQP